MIEIVKTEPLHRRIYSSTHTYWCMPGDMQNNKGPALLCCKTAEKLWPSLANADSIRIYLVDMNEQVVKPDAYALQIVDLDDDDYEAWSWVTVCKGAQVYEEELTGEAMAFVSRHFDDDAMLWVWVEIEGTSNGKP